MRLRETLETFSPVLTKLFIDCHRDECGFTSADVVSMRPHMEGTTLVVVCRLIDGSDFEIAFHEVQ